MELLMLGRLPDPGQELSIEPAPELEAEAEAIVTCGEG